jgi:FkbM family methyltransferase
MRKDAIVRAVSGPMRGMRWVVGSMPHGAWLGSLERRKLNHFVRCLKPGMTVWDIGANVGLYTLPGARAIGEGGRLYAFEPLARNCEYLRQHVRLNHLSNVVIVEAAAYVGVECLRMAEGDSASEFHEDANGDVVVPAVSLDAWRVLTSSRPPDVVKIDVEGAEAAVLRGGAQTLSAYRPIIFLALHGEGQRRDCEVLLRSWGYNIKCEQDRLLFESSEWVAQAI